MARRVFSVAQHWLHLAAFGGGYACAFCANFAVAGNGILHITAAGEPCRWAHVSMVPVSEMWPMNDDLSVPPSALLFILLQRTAYQSAILSRLLRRGPAPAGLLLARLEAFLRREAIAARFVRGIQRDYKSIAGALPKDASAILDIGCGVAAIDVLLSRHYSDRGPVELYLVDFDETSARINYGFRVTPSCYNSLKAAKELLLANKVPASAIHFLSPDQIVRESNLPPLQLVISTLAWGFHFPVETYARVVSAAMAPEGRLILDIRVGTDGLERLRDYFPVVEVIKETEVRRRVVARP